MNEVTKICIDYLVFNLIGYIFSTCLIVIPLIIINWKTIKFLVAPDSTRAGQHMLRKQKRQKEKKEQKKLPGYVKKKKKRKRKSKKKKTKKKRTGKKRKGKKSAPTKTPSKPPPV